MFASSAISSCYPFQLFVLLFLSLHLFCKTRVILISHFSLQHFPLCLFQGPNCSYMPNCHLSVEDSNSDLPGINFTIFHHWHYTANHYKSLYLAFTLPTLHFENWLSPYHSHWHSTIFLFPLMIPISHLIANCSNLFHHLPAFSLRYTELVRGWVLHW